MKYSQLRASKAYLLACICGSFVFAALSGGKANALTPEDWRADLRFFVDRVTQMHPNVFYSVRQEDFDVAVASLNQRIPTLSPEAIVVEFIRLNALIGDGHTNFYMPMHPYGPPPDQNDRRVRFKGEPVTRFHSLPVRLYVFSDGLFVSATTEEHASLLGLRVLKIGNASADDALKAVAPLVAFDRIVRRGSMSREKADKDPEGDPRPGNPVSVKAVSPGYLVTPEVLKSLGIIDDSSQVPLVGEDTTGKRVETIIKPMEPGSNPKWKKGYENSSNPLPLYLKDPENNFWFEYLPERKLVYMQYNAVAHKKDETFFQFCSKLFSFIDEHPTECLVVDMRFNGGGNSMLNRALVNGIVKRDRINHTNGLFVILGRETFSAATNCATDLDAWTNAKFVGEPNGNCIHMFGDAEYYELPNSHLRARCSTLYWQPTWARDLRPAIMPEIPALLSSADYLSNQDPALEAIFRELDAEKAGNEVGK